MAIQMRRGDYLNFDPQKMKPGELAVVQTNDPEGDGTALYFCTVAGTVKRLASYEDIVSMLYNIGDEIFVTGVKGNSESTYRTGNVNITKSDIGLSNVENKSSATIREELTKANVTSALGTGSGTSKYFREDGSWTTPPDTKNTTGSTNTSLKIFLIGATAQSDSSQTYSHDTVYVGADGCLYSENTKVVTDMIPKYNIDISSAVGTDDGKLYKALSDLNWTNIITT